MRTFVLILTITSLYNFQPNRRDIINRSADDLTQNDISTQSLEDSINSDIRKKNRDARLDHRDELDEFFKDIRKDLDDKINKNIIYNVGNFQIRVQENCEFNIPEKPTPPVDLVEVECKTARVQGHLMAKAVAELSGVDTRNPDEVMGLMAECKIIGEKAMFVTFDPFDECLKDEFKEFYDVYFVRLRGEMRGKGFRWNRREKRFEKFEEETLVQHTQETEKVDTSDRR